MPQTMPYGQYRYFQSNGLCHRAAIALLMRMRMQMVRVRHMRMCMLRRFVAMRVAVRAWGQGVVGVQVVAIIMAVSMFMLQGVVAVLMSM